MKTETLWLHFKDEGWPVIGCGQRLVEVRRGRKWVRVREKHAVSGHWKRFLRSSFEALERVTITRDKREKRAQGYGD